LELSWVMPRKITVGVSGNSAGDAVSLDFDGTFFSNP